MRTTRSQVRDVILRATGIVFFKRARLRAIGQTFGATGAFALDHLVHVMDFLHRGGKRTLGADLAA